MHGDHCKVYNLCSERRYGLMAFGGTNFFFFDWFFVFFLFFQFSIFMLFMYSIAGRVAEVASVGEGIAREGRDSV